MVVIGFFMGAIMTGADEPFPNCRRAREALGRAMAKTQLYLISPLEVGGAFPDLLAAALDAGPMAAFQFRVKGLDEHACATLAEPLQRLCADHDTAFIVNDSVSLAKRLAADGVHLGQQDGSVKEAREELGKEAQIGVTCHDSRHMAMEAGEQGADYVAFGAFFPSSTKDTSHQPDLELLSFWSQIFEIPCVAIGGITPANCAPLVTAGADFLATSHAVWGQGNTNGVAAAIKAFHEAIATAPRG